MKSNQNLRTALLATVVLAVVSCGLVGCSREEPKPAADADAVVERMQDPEYRKQLDVQKEEMKKRVSVRNGVARKMSEMVEAMKAKLDTDDTKKAIAELEKSEEWKKLSAEYEVAKKEFEANRQETMEVIRKRMNSKKPISK